MLYLPIKEDGDYSETSREVFRAEHSQYDVDHESYGDITNTKRMQQQMKKLGTIAETEESNQSAQNELNFTLLNQQQNKMDSNDYLDIDEAEVPNEINYQHAPEISITTLQGFNQNPHHN